MPSDSIRLENPREDVAAVLLRGPHRIVVGTNDSLPVGDEAWRQFAPPDQQDLIDTLLDLARQNRHDDFCFLAGSAGLPADQHEALWTGTRRRLPGGPAHA